METHKVVSLEQKAICSNEGAKTFPPKSHKRCTPRVTLRQEVESYAYTGDFKAIARN